jgi:hypothetical protein
MLNSARRLLTGARQDDVLHTAEPVEPDEVFDPEAFDLPTPTFFTQAFRDIPVNRLAERYRSARDISHVPEVLSPRPGHARPLAHYPVRAQRYSRDLEEAFMPAEFPRLRPIMAQQPVADEPSTPRPHSAMFLLAGLAAILVGGGLGYLTTRLNHADGSSALAAAAAQPPAAAAAAITTVAPQAAPASRKPIAMARLDVADVSGGLNSMIPLALHAEEPGMEQNIILKISGLPKSAYLTAGSRVGDSDWQLTAADAVGVKLVVPRADAPRFNVGVTALEPKTGEMVAPTKEITVAITDPQVTVVPASAPPPTAVKVSAPSASDEGATAIPLPSQQMAAASPPADPENLVSKGDILLKTGDLAMARQFYERAYAEGAKAAAAMGAAKTFDPVVYAQLKVQGLQPDPQQALEWYERAKAAGSAEAGAAIEALKKTAP